MKIKLNLSYKKIFLYIYILFFVANLALLGYLYFFAKKYVYEPMNKDGSYFNDNSLSKTQDLDMKKFKEVITEIEKKKQKSNVNGMKNIFE